MSLSILNSLAKDSQLFKNKKIVVIGDIALDRTFLCKKAPKDSHATHGNENILDVEQGKDDFGTVGAANCTSRFCKSFQSNSLLISVIGKDNEGERVKEILKSQKTKHKFLSIDNFQTVTKFRFFELNEHGGGYTLLYRIDKDPDCAHSYNELEKLVKKLSFEKWIIDELDNCDILLINDFEKGFLSPQVLKTLAQYIEQANRNRIRRTRKPFLIVVDPKYDWNKFRPLSVDILKANEKEACKAVNLKELDFKKVENMEILAENLFNQYGNNFQNIIITLGLNGCLFLEANDYGADLHHFPAFRPKSSIFNIATHCGDMFASALVLGLSHRKDYSSAITFANCVGSLQFTKLTGNLVTQEDICNQETLTHIRKYYLSDYLIKTISDKKEKITSDILNKTGDRIDDASSLYSLNGKTGDLIAGEKFSKALNELSSNIRNGGIIFIHGESGSGKGAILKNMSIFINGFDENIDKKNAHDVLDSEKGLDEAIEIARKRRTCIILDEIQEASDPGIGKLLTRFSHQGFNEPFCLILAGHYSKDRESLKDLFFRSTEFEVNPYRHQQRMYDLPFLISKILKEDKDCMHIKKITAVALRELLRCDYTSDKKKNWRSLTKILNESGRVISGDTLDWQHLNFECVGLKKSKFRPSIPKPEYDIQI